MFYLGYSEYTITRLTEGMVTSSPEYLDIVYDEDTSDIYYSKDGVNTIFALPNGIDITSCDKVKVANTPKGRKIDEVVSERFAYEIMKDAFGEDADRYIYDLVCRILPYYIEGYSRQRPPAHMPEQPPRLKSYNAICGSELLSKTIAAERNGCHKVVFGYYYNSNNVCHRNDETDTVIETVQDIAPDVVKCMCYIEDKANGRSHRAGC